MNSPSEIMSFLANKRYPLSDEKRLQSAIEGWANNASS